MTPRQAQKDWDAFVANLRRLKPLPPENPVAKERRIARLKKDWIACTKHYFPEYASAEFAWFHKRAARAIIAADQNDNNAIYAVLMFAREHGKSALFMFLLFYLYITERVHNLLFVSSSFDAAVDLMMPFILNLENNQRIIADFGEQKSIGQWEKGRWVTRTGFSMRCIGAEQSPRGSRAQEKRPDIIAFDDIDTDIEARNPASIKKKWNWIEQALFPTMSITATKRFIGLGNRIGKDTCITRAWEKADFKLQVDLLDAEGEPMWKERYTRKQADYMISKISYASAQKEYFNNPINEGAVFKDITWGPVPKLTKFRFLINYCDPSYRDSRKNDFKALALIGELDGKYYLINCKLKQTTTAQMINWFFDHEDLVAGASTIYNRVEEGSLQRTYYEKIFLPELRTVEKARGRTISIAADDRRKTDKFTRIEATLEPLNRQGRWIFNEAERNNPHMLRMEEQFKALEPGGRAHDDGPDACEGGVSYIKQKLLQVTGYAGGRRLGSYHY
jgi:phage terminase large subunit-like protein